MTTTLQTPPISLSSQQEEARQLAITWFEQCAQEKDKKSRPIFRLFGYAGTGKTTNTRAIITSLGLDLHRDVKFAAYTGKAAMVMQKQGLPASTIHSLIYKPVPPDQQKMRQLADLLKACTDAGEKKRLRQELQEAEKFSYELRDPYDPLLADIELLCLDECSMVNEDMLKDLLTFNIPLFVLGDPGQLPPIDGTGALIKDEPDITLTEIHRQANDNPIIMFATKARQGLPLPYGEFEERAELRALALITDEDKLKADQILCGKHVTRKRVNQEVRRLRNFKTPYPEVGDKLICLKNYKADGLFNGLMGEVVRVGDLLDFSIELDVKLETQKEGEPAKKVKALLAHFQSYFDKDVFDGVRPWMYQDTTEWDFAYALTVHKAQGSQWDNVLFIDDKMFKWKEAIADRPKWLYTGITRAAETLLIAQQ